MIRRWPVIIAAVCLLAPPVVAQETTTTDAERSWYQLRKSQDVKSKLLAERWYGAIKLQPWDDASGKFQTSAKYLAHDSNLAWVKLRVIQGTGDKRVVKDVQIPLAKLSPACQARVRQIARLNDKVTEAIAADEKKQAEEKDKNGGGEMTGDEEASGGEPRGRRGKASERRARGEEINTASQEEENPRAEPAGGLAGMNVSEATAETSQPLEPHAGGPETSGSPVTNNGPPLPALVPKLPTPDAPTPALTATAETPAAPPHDVGPPGVGDEAWRTSYTAFRANISTHGRSSANVQWGPMHALQRAHETLFRCESDGTLTDAEAAEIKQQLDEAGEVTWEATLAGTSDRGGDWTAALGLPPLTQPMQIRFVLDPERDPGAWQNAKAGNRVRFAGRFYHFDEQDHLTVAIRFLDIRPADGVVHEMQ